MKWIKRLLNRIEELEKAMAEQQDIHATCDHCGITGHKADMEKVGDCWVEYYHTGCYAEKFNVHLCPNKCGKWLPNRK